jgi:LysR family transcriptional regulator, nod-box dependent transcriptional activator
MTDPLHPLAGVDLNLLTVLDALVAERSVTRAAQRLGVTQPTASAALRRLRAQLNDEFLVRDGQAMRLTPLGESLEPAIRELLAQAEALLFPDARFEPATAQREFTIRATDYATLVLIRPLCRALAAEAPGILIKTRPFNVAEHSPLPLDDVDLLIVPDRFTAPSELPSQALFTDRFVGAAWRENPLVGEAVSSEQLGKLSFISYRTEDVPSLVDRRLDELEIPVRPEIYLAGFVVGALFLRGTRHITFLQERLFNDLAETADLRAFTVDFPLPTVTETMAWHPRLANDPGHQWLRARIAALAQEI